MRACIYARVSSAQQRDANTIAAQLAALPEYATRQGWSVVRTYVDDGHSARAGSLAKRRGLSSLLADATASPRPWDVVLVWDLDRLSRSEDQGERGHILGVLRVAGVRVASLTGGVLDLSSSEGDLLSGVQAWAAADWLRKHRERVQAGKVRAIARGGKPAGPTPYGYRYDRAGGWSICEPEAEVIREIVRRVGDGESMTIIADDLDARGVPRGSGGVWSREWVWQIARHRDYYATGRWVADKARASVVSVPVIVDAAAWAAAQEALDSWSRRGTRRSLVRCYLLQGLARCACGEPMRIWSGSYKHTDGEVMRSAPRYVCRRRLRPRRGEESCRATGYQWATERADAEVWRALTDWLMSPALTREIARERERRRARPADALRAEADAADATLAQLDRAESSLLARVRRGLVSDGAADRELASIARERAAARRQGDAARRAMASQADQEKGRDALLEAAGALRLAASAATPEQRRDLARQLLAAPVTLGEDGQISLSLALCPPSVDGCSSVTATTVRKSWSFRAA